MIPLAIPQLTTQIGLFQQAGILRMFLYPLFYIDFLYVFAGMRLRAQQGLSARPCTLRDRLLRRRVTARGVAHGVQEGTVRRPRWYPAK